MAYTVELKIVTETELEGIKTAQQSTEKLAQTTAQANQQMTQSAQQGAQRANDAYRSTMATMRQFGALIGVAGVASVAAFVRSTINLAGRLDDLSDRTGISAKTLSGLRSVLQENGQSLENFASAIQVAQRNLGQAGENADRASKALHAMGLNVEGLIQSSPEEFLRRFSEGLSKVENHNQRAAIATAVMGQAGAELAPVLSRLASDFEKLRSQGLSEETVKALDDIGDAFTRLHNRLFNFSVNAMGRVLKEFGLIQRSAQEIQRLLEHTERFAPGDVGRIRQLERQLSEARDRQDQAEIVQRPSGSLLNFNDDQEAKKREEAARSFTESIKKQNDALAIYIHEMSGAQDVADSFRIELLQQEAATLKLTDAQKKHIDNQRVLLAAVRNLKEEEVQRKANLEGIRREIELQSRAEADLAAVYEASARDREILRQRASDAINMERQLGEARADGLRIIGQTTDADRARFETQIQYLEKIREIENNKNNIPAVAVIDQQIDNERRKIERLGIVAVDVGQHIGNTLNDIFTATIQGTLKSVDVGKAAVATLGRIVTDIFQQTIKKKLVFELDLFNNLKQLPAQANKSFQAGAAAVPGNQGGGGGGFFDLFGNLFGGGGSSGGSGGGFSNAASGVSSLFSQGGALGGIGSFFSSIFGGGAASSFPTGASSMGSASGLAANQAGTLFSGTAGGTLTAGILPLIMAAFTDGFSKENLGTTLGTSAGAAIGTYIFPGIGTAIGAIVGALIGSLFNIEPNPTAILKAQFSGIFFDALEGVFKPGTVGVGVRSHKDLKGSQAHAIAGVVKQALEQQSVVWTDLMNLFPETVRTKMIPSLDGANAELNQIFGRLKFSEGGKRNIQQELEDFQAREGPRGFFSALRRTFGVGFQETLNLAGLPGAGQLAFNRLAGPTGFDLFTDRNDAVPPFLEALAKIAQFSGQLANVSPRGVTPFLTGADRDFVDRQFGNVFNSNAGNFVGNVDKLQERLSPVLDFLKQSVSESTTLFGSGIMAALEAATASEALKSFQTALGEGAKELLFKGVTEAFLASAQFNDILAPIQQTIRDFTQQAIATGQTPDVTDFRNQLVPLISDLATRGETLEPLLLELQKLGLKFDEALKIFVPGPSGPANININIEQFTGSDQDVHDLASKLDDLLRGKLDP